MDYLSDFVNSCIQENKSSISDILLQAKNRLEEIEFEYQKIESLKKEEKSLKSLIKQLNGDTNPQAAAQLNSETSFNLLDTKSQHISHAIIEFLEQSKEAPVRNIIDAVSSLEDSKFVLMSLKYLIDNKILNRCENSKKILKGDLWEEREKVLNITNLKN